MTHTHNPGIIHSSGVLRTRAGGFIQVDRSVMACLADDWAAMMVYMWLSDYANPSTGEGAYPSRETLAKHIGRTVKTVDRALATLNERGLVKVHHRWTNGQGAVSVVPDEQFNKQTSNGYLLAFYPGELTSGEASAQEIIGALSARKGGDTSVARGGTPVSPGGGHQCRTINTPDINKTPQTPQAAESERSDDGGATAGEDELSDTPAATAAALNPERVTKARGLLDEAVRENGRELSPSWRREVGEHIVHRLDDGVSVRVIERALEAFMDGTSRSPRRFPVLVQAAMDAQGAENDSQAALDASRAASDARRRQRAQTAARVASERSEGIGRDSAARAKGYESFDDMRRKMKAKSKESNEN